MRTLRVLVDEDERVGHVAVAQVDDAEAHPPPAAPLLHAVQDGPHQLAHHGALLHLHHRRRRQDINAQVNMA